VCPGANNGLKSGEESNLPSGCPLASAMISVNAIDTIIYFDIVIFQTMVYFL
jgi:hypothetical protein